LARGSSVALSGVCAVAETAPQAIGFRSTPVAFELLLRSPADVQVCAPRRVDGSQAGRRGPGGHRRGRAAAGWAAVPPRQVRRQTRVIASKLHTEALAEERQRIAREFHDTLEQELVALSLRLDTATAKMAQTPVQTLLQSCRRLVERLQSTGRDFIWDLREHTMARKICAARSWRRPSALRGNRTQREVMLTAPLPLSGRHRPRLRAPGQEACANAIRHGHARKVHHHGGLFPKHRTPPGRG